MPSFGFSVTALNCSPSNLNCTHLVRTVKYKPPRTRSTISMYPYSASLILVVMLFKKDSTDLNISAITTPFPNKYPLYDTTYSVFLQQKKPELSLRLLNLNYSATSSATESATTTSSSEAVATTSFSAEASASSSFTSGSRRARIERLTLFLSVSIAMIFASTS